MISENVVITNNMGLHARPAGIIADIAIKYKSKITIETQDTICNAKSILSILTSAIPCGKKITIVCDGEDEIPAMAELKEKILNEL